MDEFINEFGKDNFVIIIAVVAVIVLALIIIVLIEKIQAKVRRKNRIRQEISNYNRPNNYDMPIASSSTNFKSNDEELLESEVMEEKEEVVYIEEDNKEEVAKEKLEEVTKKLVEENNEPIEHTNFEAEQEEKSIISYDELVQASHDINEKNDLLLEDEGEEPITLEELYQKHIEDQNIIEEQEKDVKVNNPIFEDNGQKKFKNSEVISPVFGFYSGKVKEEKPLTTNKEEELLDNYNSDSNMKDLEVEIQKTEEFLTELKRLKNKLD